MAEYKSKVKTIPYPQATVYAKLSDLSNLEIIRENIDNPALRETVMQQAGDKVTSEQLDSIAEHIRSLQITPDTLSGDAGPMGTITLRVIDREPQKTIKFALEGAPVSANMWIQLLPSGDSACAMRLTVKADIPFFLKPMIGSKLEQGVEGLADMLAKLPYGF